MIKDDFYSAADPYIRKIATEQAKKVKAINREDDDAKQQEMLVDFFDVKPDANFYVVSPFFCEYGFNTTIGTDSGIGPNTTLSDVFKIGDRTLITYNVSIITATHPNSPESRQGSRGKEYAKPIVIGDDCWIGPNAVILPGIKVGNSDIPDGSVAVGNPAKVIKQI
ncbi:maltose O-acetyltransferase [Athelia psychrophila]|uniref:Maltose O-acetyltransferase n=1 Tax=Athelia psychrophila TaxID=1759441 RepID=A0A166HS53_9AGAM|nr:maltose O-acetyltransferase [Fibularhizoctonia sp. CBS 109695]